MDEPQPKTCQHVFQRGPKTGQVCQVRLYGELSKAALRCSLHNPARTLAMNDAAKARKEANKANLYKVVVNNTEENKVYKKAPLGPVTRMVGEQRAYDLKKKGAHVEQVVDSEDSKYKDLLFAFKQLAKDYQELYAAYDSLAPADNIGPKE